MRSFVFSAVIAVALAACGEPAQKAEAAPAAQASAGAWAVDKGASKLLFTGAQTGNKFEGAFRSFAADIVFDPDNISAASIDVTVDTGSAATGDRQRDAALPGADWFKTKEFPTAKFSSRDIIATGENAYEARGTLTIRDITRDLTLPFTLRIDGERAHAEGAVTLVRTDYGVGQGEFSTGEWVGLEVGVSFVIEATKVR
ncbi:MAG: YceI family protein [Pseudomonadota bacterium]|nr:YceI family protein [Pseudomonadota bacterium]